MTTPDHFCWRHLEIHGWNSVGYGSCSKCGRQYPIDTALNMWFERFHQLEADLLLTKAKLSNDSPSPPKEPR